MFTGCADTCSLCSDYILDNVGRMYSASYRHRLATLALLFAVFVLTPIADMLLCATEVEASYLSLTVDEERTAAEHGLPDLLQEHCDHGHCHHGLAHISTDIPGADLSWRQVHRWSDYGAAVSFTPDELMRPPKA